LIRVEKLIIHIVTRSSEKGEFLICISTFNDMIVQYIWI